MPDTNLTEERNTLFHICLNNFLFIVCVIAYLILFVLILIVRVGQYMLVMDSVLFIIQY